MLLVTVCKHASWNLLTLVQTCDLGRQRIRLLLYNPDFGFERNPHLSQQAPVFAERRDYISEEEASVARRRRTLLHRRMEQFCPTRSFRRLRFFCTRFCRER